jgi:hypothetical protein
MKKNDNPVPVYRDSGTGRFLKEDQAKRKPADTVEKERIRRPSQPKR